MFLRGRCVGFDADLGTGSGLAAVLFEGCQPVPEVKPANRPRPLDPAVPRAGSTPAKGEWTRLDPLPAWKTVWGKWSVDGQTVTAGPDEAEHWKTQLLDCRLETFRATVAVRRPAKADGWAGFDFGHREWNDRQMVMLHQARVVVSRSPA